ncbi:MAG TPA: type II toxin-antitoxin system VapC family toxin [Blastocatellia bacterium]|nr:type II toxin-antitoxin system VapC family toxin [Blastocatellia bacterium]HMV85032.1 type II toxin-antitoxin system VapC family toxin [Blastocatellia bacterium]HMX26804.1 type II toxin-antitoxin system VapC family toxin [Blastocatellia bacterium]HMY72662.1 type II toxin-antitoxin system VapC family toxin [Blastocatellia bacterium]HMZ17879.1 type II toxin-antitoxin system VapC family toxin [Blastocatellia bacterium]
MPIYYADTSVLVKRHVPEVGSAWVRALFKPSAANTIITAQLRLTELYSALNRRVREQSITPLRYQRIASIIGFVWKAQYEVITLTDGLVNETRFLLERHPLRAYDAVQLASAMQARTAALAIGTAAPIFLSADKQLLSAAQAEGFVTDDPNLH